MRVVDAVVADVPQAWQRIQRLRSRCARRRCAARLTSRRLSTNTFHLLPDLRHLDPNQALDLSGSLLGLLIVRVVRLRLSSHVLDHSTQLHEFCENRGPVHRARIRTSVLSARHGLASGDRPWMPRDRLGHVLLHLRFAVTLKRTLFKGLRRGLRHGRCCGRKEEEKPVQDPPRCSLHGVTAWVVSRPAA